VTDGKNVYAWFGNAGAICFDFEGHQKWHRKLGEFETELGLASSPVIHNDLLYVLCDHDGDRIRTFDSFLVALNKHTGEEQWRADRPGMFRSWSTPLVRAQQHELVVAGEKQLRGYDLANGNLLWHVDGLQEWVAPSPVAHQQLIIAMCGRNGPMLAVRGGPADDSSQRLIWQHPTGGAYVCSPLIYQDHLYVHDEDGILACYELKSGVERYRQRLQGKFYSSAVAAEGRIYVTNDEGTTFVVGAGPQFQLIAQNRLAEEVLASPAISRGDVLLRTSEHLYCISK
jgi:outer membrane protein assembly factor BamB